ncbi:asparagine synthase-related protein [Streptomyces sp. NPDC006658]|uniref:asparagine synthase-related protein n=1 Tax=Streptomyces sp. NPDC006658 TaxID=3156900 RepID=UPI0033FEB90C
MPAVEASWFVALPDCPAGERVAANLRARARAEVAHPSGRAWLMGVWRTDELLVLDAGRARVVVCGVFRDADVRAASASARPAELLRAVLPGSFHVAVSHGDGRVSLRGGAHGVRQVFTVSLGGVTVAGDRADVLARLAGARVEPAALAARLLLPSLPQALADTTVWQGVRAVPPGRLLTLTPEGRAGEERWWTPPAEELSLREGARLLSTELRRSVEARATLGPLTADLSGGLDSTSLSLLAHRAGARLTTVSVAGIGDEDMRWAARARSLMPDATHLTLDAAGDLARCYAELADAWTPPDEPFPEARTQARLRGVARCLAGRGACAHLAGLGGDELFAPAHGYLHDLARREPLLALRHLSAYRAHHRWRPRQALGLIGGGPGRYAQWLAGQRPGLRANIDYAGPPTSWGYPLRLPPWATGTAAELVCGLIETRLPEIAAQADGRGRHLAVERVRAGARNSRLYGRAFEAEGVRCQVPFFDDTVVDACLRVRSGERFSPWEYKPLLKEAVTGVLPPELLARRTKDETSQDAHDGLRRHRRQLLGLCEDSALAVLGLIDAETLRATLSGPLPPRLPIAAVTLTLGGEVWLRAQAGRPVTGGGVECGAR